MRLDGKVTTGILGADAQWERWLAGVALSVSEGKGTFDQPGVDSGTVESTLTSVNPYPCGSPFGLPSSVPVREAVRRSGRRLVRPAGCGRDGVPKAREAVASDAPAQEGVLVA